MAFVLILHLAPTHASLLAEILARDDAACRSSEAHDDQERASPTTCT